MSVVVKDDFLSEENFSLLQDYCKESEFKKHVAGDKEFLALPTPEFILPYLQKNKYQIIFTFIRKAHAEFDTDWRIHADNIINGSKVDSASVLYIDFEENEFTGTAFWIHKEHGKQLPKDVSNEVFDKVLVEDANAPEKWNFNGVIGALKNRLLTYNANYFHSKYPNKIERGERIVLVVFYKKL